MAKKGRIDSIQVLRAIAFLEIFLGHCGVGFFTGSFGVAIFIVLSGFCMAINYLPKADTLSLSPVKNVKFGISKVGKLYGLHLIMLAIIYVIVKMPSSGEAIRRLITDILLLKCWRPYSEDYFSYNGVAWYLSMYLFVCMLAPYVMKLIARMKNKKQVLAVSALIYGVMLLIGYYVSVVTIPIGDNFAVWMTYINPLYRILDFSLGAMLGWLYLNCDWKKYHTSGKATVLEVFAAAAFILADQAYPSYGEIYIGIGYTAYFTLTALLLVWVFAVNGGWITKALNNRLLLWIGNISSMTFLIHQVVIRWVEMNLEQNALGKWYLPVVIVVCFIISAAGAEAYLFLQKKVKRQSR